jgi:hypothetical protein
MIGRDENIRESRRFSEKNEEQNIRKVATSPLLNKDNN